MKALRGKPCRFLGDSRKLVVAAVGSSYYPDGAIACPPNDLEPRQGTYDNPTVVFEVLSPRTERFDRTLKFDDYRNLVSLRDYVLIGSEEARVEVFSRMPDGRWAFQVFPARTVARLPSIGLDLALDELYENVVLRHRPSAPSGAS